MQCTYAVQQQVVPHSKGVERPHCCAVSLPLSLDTSKHTPGSKRSHDPKAGLCRQPQGVHLYSIRVIAGHEGSALYLLLSRDMDKQEEQPREAFARKTGAMPCRIDDWWVSALTTLGTLPPTLPGTSPNFPQQASRCFGPADNSRGRLVAADTSNLLKYLQ